MFEQGPLRPTLISTSTGSRDLGISRDLGPPASARAATWDGAKKRPSVGTWQTSTLGMKASNMDTVWIQSGYSLDTVGSFQSIRAIQSMLVSPPKSGYPLKIPNMAKIKEFP